MEVELGDASSWPSYPMTTKTLDFVDQWFACLAPVYSA